MRKTALLLIIAPFIAGMVTQDVSARIWRVNNKSNYNGTTLFGDNLGGTASYPVFKELNQAVTWGAVTNGDTLHIEASPSIYADATITKKLAIIGPGFFLNENPNTSSTVSDARIATIVFSGASAGSQLIGMNVIANGNTGNRIYMNVNDLTVKRCRIERFIELGTATTGPTIVQNFFPNTGDANALTTNGNTFYVYPSDVIFNNNICQKTLIWAGPILQCRNNVFNGPANALNLQFSTSDFKNNILRPVNATANINNGTNLNVSYNIGSSAVNQFGGTANNNLVVADMNTLFVASTNTTDGDYQLQANSAGSNNGSDGSDRGAFGGLAVTSRYTLSGLAAIPVIYEVNTTGVAGPAGLPVSIKARTIK